MTEITTQAGLDAALKAEPNGRYELRGTFRLVLTGSVAPWLILLGATELHVVAWGSSQPHVEAWGSSQPHVEARESSQPHVVARESSQPHVEAWGSSQPHVEAWGSSQPHVVAWGSSQPHVVARESSQPHVVAWESSQPHVEARESSQPHVVAWGSSQPHVVAWGSSQPHVVARESSQPHVVAWGSSQPHVVASGYCQLSLRGKIKGSAGPHCAVLIDGPAKIDGGHQVVMEARATPQAWCDYYGVRIEADVAILFKAVNADGCSPHGTDYSPGLMPAAPDWDGGKRECGGGLHFSPHPMMALAFHNSAKRFIACPVALTDIAVHPNGDYPEKVKARGCAGPTVECDRYGKPLVAPVPSKAKRSRKAST